jgi:hypothetical protein
MLVAYRLRFSIKRVRERPGHNMTTLLAEPKGKRDTDSVGVQEPEMNSVTWQHAGVWLISRRIH